MSELFNFTKHCGAVTPRSALYFPACYALVSGGKDSLTAAQVLHENGKLLGCVSFRTGIATPDWEAFVAKTCAKRGWNHEFYTTPESYDDLVLEYGFPGPGRHPKFMDRLKGRCVRLFKKAHPDGILASGTRKNESKRRFGGTRPFSLWENVPIIAPIYDWPTYAVWEFFYDRGFERAPAYSTLQISGDCLCGSFVDDPEERKQIDFHYPNIGARLDALSGELKRRGKCPSIRCEWGWGWKRPKKDKSRAENAICFECGDAADEAAAKAEGA